jgi:hypothetical protein
MLMLLRTIDFAPNHSQHDQILWLLASWKMTIEGDRLWRKRSDQSSGANSAAIDSEALLQADRATGDAFR